MDEISFFFRRVAGWLAGGCYDYHENDYLVGGLVAIKFIFPLILGV